MTAVTCPRCRHACPVAGHHARARVMCPKCGDDFEPDGDPPHSDWPSRGSAPLRVAGAFLFAAALLGGAGMALVAWLRR